MSTVKPEGYHTHHRKKRRSKDDRPVNLLFVSPTMHEWIEKHPEEARRLGWTVPQHEDPESVTVVIPDQIISAPEKKPRAKRDKARPRAVLQVRVPKDQAEDGSKLWDEMIDIGREFLCPVMGWDDDVPAYNVAMVLMARGLEVTRDEVKEEG